MNLDSKEDLRLVDHLNKCRCCFEKFDRNEEQVEITEIIEEQFLELTQIELKPSPIYSNKVCMKCAIELQSISSYRLNLITKQQQLYEFVMISQYTDQDVIIFEPVDVKTETQASNNINNNKFEHFLTFETQYEEIDSLEVPVDSDTKKAIKQFSCTICDYQSPRNARLLLHMKTHDPKVKTKTTKIRKKQTTSMQMCPDCGIFVNSSGSLQKHIRNVHLKLKHFFCDFCGYGAFFKHGLENHMKTHLPKMLREKFFCDQCEFVSISTENMRNHKRYDHCSQGKRKFECHCGKVFGRPGQLSTHKKLTHENQKNHICTICTKAYSTSTRLKIHMAHHTGKREIACEVCGKMFVTLQQLRNHSVYHKDPRFICSFDGCTKKFYSGKYLENHRKTHIGQRDFACHLCDNKYFVASHLHRHVLHFHKQLKVSCELPGCSSKFARKETYRNHVLSHHKDLSQDKIQSLLKKIREMKQE